jgi:hypothetical protein
MDDDLHLGLYVIKVLCLVVIAMSLYKVSYGSDSYFSDKEQGAASLRMVTQRSDFMGSGSVEAPVFWNLGSVEDTNTLLQSAAKTAETNESFTAKKIHDLEAY